MNRARLRERIRNSPIRGPVASPNDPPIYHAARPNGKSLRVAYYQRVKSDLIDMSIYYGGKVEVLDLERLEALASV